MTERRGWYQPRALPHFDGGGIQTVTFRTADSMPQTILNRLHAETAHLEDEQRNRRFITVVENELDSLAGECRMKDESIGRLVVDAILHFDRVRYVLHAWVVMPNHVHVMFRPLDNYALADIVKSWKSFSAKRINQHTHRIGKFWARDYFDRGIRDGPHFENVFEYIENNPVRAGLCKEAEDWPSGSAGTGRGRQPLLDVE